MANGRVWTRLTQRRGTAIPPDGQRDLVRELAEELRLRGYSPRTGPIYVGHIRRFLDHLGGPPRWPREDAKRFLLYLLRERRFSHSYVAQAVSAVKCLYRFVLEVDPPDLEIPRPKGEKKLPVVMSHEEVARLLRAVRNPKHRAILMLVYAAGLRVGEVVRLKVSDIDPERGQLRVRQAKGRRDRSVMLSRTALEALEEYWPHARPKDWLFPGRRPGRHLTTRTVQHAFRKARERAGIKKRVSVHSLRHAFATHLLESGTDVRYIQKLLGHKSTKTTEIYTRVSRRSLGRIQSPLDRLAEEGRLVQDAGGEEARPPWAWGAGEEEGIKGPSERGKRPRR